MKQILLSALLVGSAIGCGRTQAIYVKSSVLDPAVLRYSGCAPLVPDDLWAAQHNSESLNCMMRNGSDTK